MAAPGWYGEPGDPTLVRYWDGVQWTPHTQPSRSMPMGYGAQPAPWGVPAHGEAERAGIGVAGLIVCAIGVVGVVIAFTGAKWFDLEGGPTLNFGDLRGDPFIDGFAGAYVGWLGWLLLVATAAVTIAACVPSRHRRALRAVGAGVGIVSSFATIGALVHLSSLAHTSFGQLLHQFAAGPYLAVFGLLVIAIGASVSELATA
ncbi:MAG: DUF2510 domain-containing protein [Solirubrobacteraceae bacterium]